MELALGPAVRQMIEDCVTSGEFASAEEVVSAAVQCLRIGTSGGDFASGELNTLILQAERSGPALRYEDVRAELKALRDSPRESRP